jgi:hypothetical protein
MVSDGIDSPPALVAATRKYHATSGAKLLKVIELANPPAIPTGLPNP